MARPSTCSPIWTTCEASSPFEPASASTAVRIFSDDESNYLGTYLFDSPDRVRSRKAANLHQRASAIRHRLRQRPGRHLYPGRHPRAEEPHVQPGLRYELQTHLSDYNNFGPRFGDIVGAVQEREDLAARQLRRLLRLAGREYLRAVAARRWIPAARAEHRQPVVPDPGRRRHHQHDESVSAERRPADGAEHARASIGVDQTFSPRVRAGLTYAHTTGTDLMRGENLNAPINGVRPDPLFVNVIRVVHDAASRQDVLNVFGHSR